VSIHDERKSLLREFFREVWNDGNAPAAAKYLAPAYTIAHDPGDPWEGRELDLEGFQERLRHSRAPFPDQRFEIQTMLADRDSIAVSWTWTGTHRGDLPGFPATHREMRMSGITIYLFQGLQLRGHWQVADRLAVLQQLREGALVEPGVGRVN
jgi:steroid delta-isomerase-like uncharacterized protein